MFRHPAFRRYTTTAKMVEQTLALIKPDAMAAGSKSGILARIKEAGFTVAAEKELQLSKACDEGSI